MMHLLLNHLHVSMIYGHFCQVPVLIMADFNKHWKRFISYHDLVMRGSNLGEVLILVHVLVHLHVDHRSVLLRRDLSVLVCVANTRTAS